MMDRFKLSLVSIIIMTISVGCAAGGVSLNTPEARLKAEIDHLLADPAFASATWGVYIESPDKREVLYRRNEDKLLIPASNLKLFTTAVALVRFGPNFTYKTRLYYDGKIQNGTLKGDLVIRGSGDPTISGRYNGGDLTATFREWSDSLKSLGINRIEGNIIGDDDYFDDVPLGKGWSWDDEPQWYSAHTSGLSFNDNAIDLKIRPGENPGDKAVIKLDPPTSYVQIKNNIRTTEPDSISYYGFSRSIDGNLFTFWGKFPVNKKESKTWASVRNPTLYTATVLKETLESAGIEITGEAKDVDDISSKPDYSKIQVAAVYTSPPMSTMIKTVNKPSQNFYAEQLLKTLGKEYQNEGSWSAGVKVVKSFLNAVGIDGNAIKIVDGSGLSRLNLVSPRQVATLLRYMRQHRYGKYYYDSLPIAGLDGTIRRRMIGTNAQGNLRAKTGHISYVRALSGYVTTADGEDIVFSFIVNNYDVPTSMADELQNRIGVILSNYSRGN
ncbi:MAG: D-alanyl-D-alanine carboxypeptidase/D-alanyl-D-alanine-endopeptidase [Candidatus Marinimicrobia bacterium]|nr:D-alanyl-D-alanine carboxypeptidase/D-alanyl-D-alanine-endopeptidase [Candidatus Neomarinimicrobiota bacterium]